YPLPSNIRSMRSTWLPPREPPAANASRGESAATARVRELSVRAGKVAGRQAPGQAGSEARSDRDEVAARLADEVAVVAETEVGAFRVVGIQQVGHADAKRPRAGQVATVAQV